MSFTHPTQEWSIGIFKGASPVDLHPLPGTNNPVLTKNQITDVTAAFVADPFLVRTEAEWHIFFEVMDAKTGRGKIGLATSADASVWQYRQIILDEPFHLSYPYVFEHDGRHYMVPESHQAKAVRLYEATRFPTRWDFSCTLLEGPRFADSSLLRWRQRWWLFSETNPIVRHSTLRLFHAEHLTGPWIEHRKSPIVHGNAHIARPAGRVIIWRGNPIRFSQDCDPIYGTSVRAFAVTQLTADAYEEQALSADPILKASASEWNSGGMHHIDAHQLPGGDWLAGVDGWRAVGPGA